MIADRKGRRVLVQRSGSEEARARNELEANGYGPPRRPQRSYHGKRDLKPKDESASDTTDMVCRVPAIHVPRRLRSGRPA